MSLASCSKTEPQSTTDPLPLPSEIDANKDLSVKPGDSFFDYCNGTWLEQTPIPASGNAGGLYDVEKTMEEYVQQLKALVPDIGHEFTHGFDTEGSKYDKDGKDKAGAGAIG